MFIYRLGCLSALCRANDPPINPIRDRKKSERELYWYIYTICKYDPISSHCSTNTSVFSATVGRFRQKSRFAIILYSKLKNPLQCLKPEIKQRNWTWLKMYRPFLESLYVVHEKKVIFCFKKKFRSKFEIQIQGSRQFSGYVLMECSLKI